MNLTKEEFKDKIFNYEEESEWKFKGDKDTVLKFSASWCVPCQSYDPVYESYAKENENIDFYSIDVDEESELAQSFGVRSVPTTIFIPKDGSQPQAASGSLPKTKLTEISSQVFMKS